MSSWKDVMKQQQDDLERMEAMDAQLNTEPVLSEVDRVLKKPASTFGLFTGRAGSSSARRSMSGGERTELDFTSLNLDDLNAAGAANGAQDESFGADPTTARSLKSTARTGPAFGSSRRGGPPSPGGATPPPSAPDAQARYAKAKVKQLEAAMAESDQLRLKLNEQLAETKRLLIAEREENKKLKNRVKLLEIENRKVAGGARRPGSGAGDGAVGAGAGDDAQVDSLKQEIELLRKDLATAERLAKAADANAKAKETQLNRTAEVIARQKKQLADQGSHDAGSRETERARADAAEARCKSLEKQRTDLVAGFKKQMKLIDNLKVGIVLSFFLARSLLTFPFSLPSHPNVPEAPKAAPRGSPRPRIHRRRVHEAA